MVLVSIELSVDENDGVDDLLEIGEDQEGGGQVGPLLHLLPLGHRQRLQLEGEIQHQVQEGAGKEGNRENTLVPPSLWIFPDSGQLGHSYVHGHGD